MRLVMPVERPVVTAQVASFTGSRVVRLGLSLSRFDVDFIENCFHCLRPGQLQPIAVEDTSILAQATGTP